MHISPVVVLELHERPQRSGSGCRDDDREAESEAVADSGIRSPEVGWALRTELWILVSVCRSRDGLRVVRLAIPKRSVRRTLAVLRLSHRGRRPRRKRSVVHGPVIASQRRLQCEKGARCKHGARRGVLTVACSYAFGHLPKTNFTLASMPPRLCSLKASESPPVSALGTWAYSTSAAVDNHDVLRHSKPPTR